MGILRVILALGIMAGHYKLALGATSLDVLLPYLDTGGAQGAIKVNAFFLISGFYTQLLLMEKFTHVSVKNFYLSRLVRLLPDYFICFLLLILLSAILAANGYTAKRLIPMESLSHLYFWFQNVFLYLPGIFCLSDCNPQKVTGVLALRQAWTLPIEFTLLALSPFMLTRKKWFPIAFCVSAALAVYYAMMGNVRDFFGATMLYFMLGAACYRLYKKHFTQAPRTQKTAWIAYGLLISLALLMLYFGVLVNAFGLMPAYVMFMAAVTICLPFIAAFAPRTHTDRVLSQLTYPVYLSHFMAFRLVKIASIPYGFPVAVLGSFAFAGICYALCDRPLNRWRDRLAEPAS